MINNLSHRIVSISMALLILLSSTGFFMDIHYCQEQLKSISFLGKAKSCHDKVVTPICHNNTGNVQKSDQDNCCHNESIVIEKSDIEATTTQLATIQDIQLEFVAAFVAVYVLNYNIEAKFQPYIQYDPPLPDRDIQVLYQSFLI